MLGPPADAVDVTIGLLGPFVLRVRGRSVPVRSPQHRTLLAALALQTGQVVTVRDLVAAVWDGHEPRNPRRAVQLAMVRLRAQLAATGCAGLITTSADGYRIELLAESLDVNRFRRQLDDADRAADPAAAVAALRRALHLWRGEPLTDVPSGTLHRLHAPGLHEQRLRALERRFDAGLRLGHHHDLVDELRTATAAHPLRERLSVQLVTALHRDGRRADALAAYHTARRHIADALGVDPGEELRRLHASVLDGLRSHATGAVLAPAVPHQVPAGRTGFAGRTAELAALDAMLAPHRDPSSPARLVVVTGTAGVGKTALALRWARLSADRFPDGQLWADLRGHRWPRGPRVSPGAALGRFLHGLGAPHDVIPSDPQSRAGLYRTLMDGRRALVVIDDAGAAEDVRPLLPGGPGSAVLVTSRDELTGLVAADGAGLLHLAPLVPRRSPRRGPAT
ncbi:transcriptional regulator [Dactylosporangium sp. NBC_01737]|uniref:AfsR/SARP family transcriptional regulator n=1 Tax=Dactylosporangium sp. NBC_01737 TaxID=2975959 RepID=UPI002E121456|nr:transcriptional regulator [Dactylosporangium sp. NBC_01737]